MPDLLPVDVPEWGGQVMVRVWTSADFDRVMQAMEDGSPLLRALVARVSVCDGEGSLLFTDDDLDWLQCKSGTALERVYRAALHHNHLFDLPGQRRRLRGSPSLLFKHRLAATLCKSLAELDASMDARERVAWLVFNMVEPLPQPWLQTGVMTAHLCAAQGVKNVKPTDFMPLVKEPPRPMTGDQMKANMRAALNRVANP